MEGRETFLNHGNNTDEKIIQGVEVHSGQISHVKPTYISEVQMMLPGM